MKKDLTELVFILDKSSSMSGLESDTIGGFNMMLDKQRQLPGECRITTALFSDRYWLLHDRIDIKGVLPLTQREYQVGGWTALLDAMGQTIHKIGDAQKNTKEEHRADKVVFVIITDGQENASRRYSADKVKAMVSKQKEKHGWEFIFLGANIDAVETAGRMGIDADRALDYVPDATGTQLNFEKMSQAIHSFRSHGALSEDALEDIRRDYRQRGGK